MTRLLRTLRTPMAACLAFGRRVRRVLLICSVLASPAIAARGRPLEIYFIDVEGGQSTLIVTPERRSLLIDTGFAGSNARDAHRIVAAMRDAGIDRIDDLLVTHFHPDHEGGVVDLVKLKPIGTLIDHESISPDAAENPDYRTAYDAYIAARGSHAHLQPTPGGRLPFADVDATVVSTDGTTIKTPLPGAGAQNAACAADPMPARDPFENPRSTGVILRYGKFRFLDVGDLTGKPLFDLVCPRNVIGEVDVYLVAHHGGPDAADPATFAAFRPRVAIMNNGLSKRGAPATFDALHHAAGPMDVWQLHRSAEAGDRNFADERIANLDESTAYWIKLTAFPDGSFKITNRRIGSQTDYAAATHRNAVNLDRERRLL